MTGAIRAEKVSDDVDKYYSRSESESGGTVLIGALPGPWVSGSAQTLGVIPAWLKLDSKLRLSAAARRFAAATSIASDANSWLA
jgi:hypothetical protein